SVARITEDPDGDLGPSWSPDGRLCWIKETEGHTVLYVDGKPATKSWALMRDPRWSPDGKSIVLAADVGGVWDAFEVDPATGKAKRLTKFRGGVRFPSWHPTDGTLVITYFEARGTDLYRVKPSPQDEPAFDQEERKPWYDQFKKTEAPARPEEKSRVFGVNWLMFPVTSYSLILPGAEFEAGDRDAENTLSAMGYLTGSRYWTAGAALANTRWRPTIGAAGYATRVNDMLEALGTGFVNLPLLETFEVGAGWVVRERNEYFDDKPGNYIFDSGPSASILYTNQRGVQPRDPSWGLSMGGTATMFSEQLGGDRELNEYFTFLETSTNVIDQDLILWMRARYDRLAGRKFLEDEFLKIERYVRGARRA